MFYLIVSLRLTSFGRTRDHKGKINGRTVRFGRIPKPRVLNQPPGFPRSVVGSCFVLPLRCFHLPNMFCISYESAIISLAGVLLESKPTPNPKILDSRKTIRHRPRERWTHACMGSGTPCKRQDLIIPSNFRERISFLVPPKQKCLFASVSLLK